MSLGTHCSIQSISSLVYLIIGVASWKPNIAQRHAFFFFFFDKNAICETCTSQLSSVHHSFHIFDWGAIVCQLCSRCWEKRWTMDTVPVPHGMPFGLPQLPDMLSWPLKPFAFAIE